MRRLATISALAFTLTAAPFALAPAQAATGASRPAATVAVVTPDTPQWVFVTDLPDQLWICYYEGNQLVSQGKYQAYECLAGPPGQLALWGETF